MRTGASWLLIIALVVLGASAVSCTDTASQGSRPVDSSSHDDSKDSASVQDVASVDVADVVDSGAVPEDTGSLAELTDASGFPPDTVDDTSKDAADADAVVELVHEYIPGAACGDGRDFVIEPTRRVNLKVPEGWELLNRLGVLASGNVVVAGYPMSPLIALPDKLVIFTFDSQGSIVQQADVSALIGMSYDHGVPCNAVLADGTVFLLAINRQYLVDAAGAILTEYSLPIPGSPWESCVYENGSELVVTDFHSEDDSYTVMYFSLDGTLVSRSHLGFPETTSPGPLSFVHKGLFTAIQNVSTARDWSTVDEVFFASVDRNGSVAEGTWNLLAERRSGATSCIRTHRAIGFADGYLVTCHTEGPDFVHVAVRADMSVAWEGEGPAWGAIRRDNDTLLYRTSKLLHVVNWTTGATLQKFSMIGEKATEPAYPIGWSADTSGEEIAVLLQWKEWLDDWPNYNDRYAIQYFSVTKCDAIAGE